MRSGRVNCAASFTQFSSGVPKLCPLEPRTRSSGPRYLNRVVQFVIISPANPDSAAGRKTEAAERGATTIQFMLGIHSRASSPETDRFSARFSCASSAARWGINYHRCFTIYVLEVGG